MINKKLIKKNDKILIAFSGGGDSVFLFYQLNSLKNEYNLQISLLYVNHNLRNDVENDLKFVKEFARENNVEIFIENADVISYCEKNKKSIELGARELRYKILQKKMNEIGYNKIATGHNLDDNVETIIFRLVRGTSVKGLKGIPEKRENIIRPILQFKKSEILNYLNKNGKKYLIDYTNNENDYTRNYIRNEIFPMFSKINKNFKNRINDLIFEINERDENFEEINKKDELVKFFTENNVEISRNKINKIYKDFFEDNGNLKKNGSKEFNLGNNKILQSNYGVLKIIEKIEKNENKYSIIKQNQSVEWYNYKVMMFDVEKVLEMKNVLNSLIFKIDENSIKLDKNLNNNYNIKVIIRKRKDGDVIKLNNLGHKKVKKILIDEKISRWERDELPIIEMEICNESENIDSEILAVADIKFSKYLKKLNFDMLKNMKNNDKILILRRKDGR